MLTIYHKHSDFEANARKSEHQSRAYTSYVSTGHVALTKQLSNKLNAYLLILITLLGGANQEPVIGRAK